MDRRFQQVFVTLTLALALAAGGCKDKPTTPEPVDEAEESGETDEPTEEDESEEEASEDEEEDEDEVTGRNVVMIIACKDFRDEELLTPKKILEDAGHDVTVASTATEGCKGMKGATVDPDMLLEDIVTDEYDAMVFIGGTGSTEYYEDETALTLAKEAEDEGLTVGAICLAPGILAKAGVLDGKKVTAYDSDVARKALEEGGAEYTGSKVTVDGVYVTGNGPEAAEAFGEKLTEMLK